MAILFRCTCDKKLEATEAFAGRQVRCPGCSRVLRIPSGGPTAAFVYFACSCGKKMKAYKNDAGAYVDCPACGREQQIPRPSIVKMQPVSPTVSAPPRRPRTAVASEPALPLSRRPHTAVASEPALPLPRRPHTAVASEPALPLPASSPRLAPSHPVMPAPMPVAAPALAALPSAAATAGPKETPRAVRHLPHAGPTQAQDTCFAQHATPWQSDEARKRNGPPPAERRVKGLPWVPIFAVLVLALLVGEWFFVKGGSEHAAARADVVDELTLLPPDALQVVTIRFADLWRQEPEFRKDSSALRYANNCLRAYFVDPKLKWDENDIERVTLVWMPILRAPEAQADQKTEVPYETCLIVHMRKPVSAVNVENRLLKGPAKERFTPTSFYRRTFREAVKIDRAVYFASDNVFVVSTIKGMEHFLHSRPSPQDQTPLALRLQAASKHDLVIANAAHHYFPLPSHKYFPAPKGKQAKDGWPAGLSELSIMTVDEGRNPTERQVTAELQMQDKGRFSLQIAPKTPPKILGFPAEMQGLTNEKIVESKGLTGKITISSEIKGKAAVFKYEGKGPEASKLVDDQWMEFAAIVVAAPKPIAPRVKFRVTAPADAKTGESFSFTVSALDPFNLAATGYTGTISFTSNDVTAVLPANAKLNAGKGTFTATFNTPGSYVLTVTDTVDAAFTGTSGPINVIQSELKAK